MKTVRHTPNLVRLTRLGAVNAFLVVEDDGLTLVDTLIPQQPGRDPRRRRAISAARSRGSCSPTRTATTSARSTRSPRPCRTRRSRSPARDARFLAGDKTLDPGEPQSKLRGGYPKLETRPGRPAEPGRPRRLARGRRRPRPHARPGRVPRHARPHADRRRRLLDARRRRDHREGQPALPAARLATWDKATALRTRPRAARADPARLAVGHGNVVESPAPAMDAAIARAEGR